MTGYSRCHLRHTPQGPLMTPASPLSVSCASELPSPPGFSTPGTCPPCSRRSDRPMTSFPVSARSFLESPLYSGKRTPGTVFTRGIGYLRTGPRVRIARKQGGPARATTGLKASQPRNYTPAPVRIYLFCFLLLRDGKLPPCQIPGIENHRRIFLLFFLLGLVGAAA
jgi:hypothetical protein